jgi:hypothetical protein
MLLYIITCLLLLLYLLNNTEFFTIDSIEPLNTSYKRYIIQTDDKKHDSLNMEFLNKVNTEYKNAIKDLTYEQLSDKFLLDKIKKDIFYKAYNTVYQTINETPQIEKCQFLAQKICTLPFVSYSQTNFPSPYFINTYKNSDSLVDINLKCYNEMYNCCKQSYK